MAPEEAGEPSVGLFRMDLLKVINGEALFAMFCIREGRGDMG